MTQDNPESCDWCHKEPFAENLIDVGWFGKYHYGACYYKAMLSFHRKFGIFFAVITLFLAVYLVAIIYSIEAKGCAL